LHSRAGASKDEKCQPLLWFISPTSKASELTSAVPK
jgi:hypothetical protein